MLPVKTTSLQVDRVPGEELDRTSIWWENPYQASNELQGLYTNAQQLRLSTTRRFGPNLCRVLRSSGLYGEDLEAHEKAPDTQVRLYAHDTSWMRHGNHAGAVLAPDSYMLLLDRVKNMTDKYEDGVVLVYYASLRTMLRDWLTQSGYDQVSVRTIRQSKGTSAFLADMQEKNVNRQNH